MKRGPEPIGIGTPAVESLSSYVLRLAAWHVALPSQLLHRWLAHGAAGKPEFSGRWRRNTGSIRLVANMNGFTHADAWLSILQQELGRVDLRNLTMRPWDELFSSRTLISPELRWCPSCLASDPEPYFRLSWSVKSVTCCPIHHCQLERHCFSCGKVAPGVHSRSTTTHCCYCSAPFSGPCASATPSSDALHAVNEVGALLALATKDAARLVSLSGRRLREIAATRGIENLTTLAKFTDMRKSTAWTWWHGENLPSLSSTLKLTRVLEISLPEALLPDAPRSLHAAPTHHQLSLHFARPDPPKHRDWKSIRKRLRAESRVPLIRAMTMLAVARELDIEPRTLRHHEPELCRKISTRWREKERVLTQARYDSLKRDIQEVVKSCRIAGVPVTARIVAESIHRPGLFSRPNARRALAEVLTEAESPWPKAVTFPTVFRAIRRRA